MLKSPVWVQIKRTLAQGFSKSLNIWYRPGYIWLTCQCVLFSQAAGQSLALSSAAAAPGGQVAIELSLRSPAGKEPAALQWEMSVPTAKLSLADENPAAGPAAYGADKSLRCVANKKTPQTYTSTCILAGGQKPIQNGVIAVLRLRILPTATPGMVRIRVVGGTAVSSDVKSIPIAAAQTDVVIRAK